MDTRQWNKNLSLWLQTEKYTELVYIAVQNWETKLLSCELEIHEKVYDLEADVSKC